MSSPEDVLRVSEQDNTEHIPTAQAGPLQLGPSAAALFEKQGAAAQGAAAPAERKEPLTFGKCGPEYIPLLQSLLRSYNERRKNLKEREHKRTYKQIYSLMQGFDGITAPCYCGCGVVMNIDDMEVHHITGDKHDNRIISLGAVTPLCNKRLNGVKGGEINRQRAAAHRSLFSVVGPVHDRERQTHPQPQPNIPAGHDPQWASKEGAQGEIMREAFNNWRRSGHGGWMTKGEIQRVSHIAAKAVYACSDKPGKPLGSDQTYAKYIHVDAVNGIYDVFKERGVWMAQYVGELDDDERLTQNEIFASQTQWRQAGGPEYRDTISKGQTQ